VRGGEREGEKKLFERGGKRGKGRVASSIFTFSSMFEEIVGRRGSLRGEGGGEKVAPTDSTVLISGETEKGKNLACSQLSNRSARGRKKSSRRERGYLRTFRPFPSSLPLSLHMLIGPFEREGRGEGKRIGDPFHLFSYLPAPVLKGKGI